MQKNFVAFILVSVLILAGWMLVQNQFRPANPPPKDDQHKAAEKKDKPKEVQKKPRPAALWKDLSPGTKEALWAALAVTAPLSHGLPIQIPEYVAHIPRPEPEANPQQFTLGGKDYFLQAVLSTRGAGVVQVTLNQFEGADRLGLPTHEPLHLVPEDPLQPSFLLYHYPKADDSHPVFTLGRKLWKHQGTTTDAHGVQEIRFVTLAPTPYSHLRIIKTYRLAPREYHLELSLEIQDVRSQAAAGEGPAFRYQLAGAHGLPCEGEWYSSPHSAMIGMVDNRNSLWRDLEDARRISFREGGDRVPDTPQRGDSFLQYAGVANQYFAAMIVVDNLQASRDEGGVDMKSILAWARPTLESTEFKGQIRSIARDRKSMLVQEGDRLERFTLLPRTQDAIERDQLKEGEAVVVSYYRIDERGIATRIRRGREFQPFTDDITVRVNSDPVVLKPGERVVHKFLLYHGPVKVALLGQLGKNSPDADLIERYVDTLHLRTMTDYRSAGPFGWFAQKIMWTNLLIACTKLMHWLLHLLYTLVGSYGLSIFFLTVIVRGLMIPISRKQAYISMKMQELGPELKKVKEKHKNDPRARQDAMMELYRKHNVNPVGGCLPLLLQMPIFLGLYYALQESVHFRLASFFWIPNLAAPDMLIWWGEGIPWISDPDNMGSIFYLGPYFNLLPVAAVTLMIIQTKMMTPPALDEQQAAQQKMMKYMMIFMGVMFYKMAAGLCLYFIASTLWGLAERKLLPRKAPGSAGHASDSPPSGSKPGQAAPRPTAPRTKPRSGKKDKDAKKENGALQKVKDWWAEVLKQARKK
jgi:YidC/Oxa1 family membrane protein insertase